MKHGVTTKVEHKLLITSVHEALKANANIFVELGVKRAGTTNAIANIFNQQSNELYLVGIDITDKAQLAWQRKIESKYTKTFKGCFMKSDSAEAAAVFKDKSVAWCFVDACHTYEYVCRDIEAWYPKISYNGLLVFHDTGVRFNLLNLRAKHKRHKEKIGVLRALLEYTPVLLKAGFIPWADIEVGFFDTHSTGLMIFKHANNNCR